VILQATTKVRCPNCGKNLMINVDITSREESWIEECKFCSQSLHVASKQDNGRIAVTADKL